MKEMSKKDKKEFFENVVHKSIKDVVKSLPKRRRLKPPQKRKKPRDIKRETWLLQLSDFHFGEVVKAVEVGGIAEYDPDIATDRLGKLLYSVIRMLDYAVVEPKELVIAFQGDNIDNAIMRGQQYGQVAYGIFEQVITATELFVDFVIGLSKYFYKIRCYGVPGNHGRMTRKPTDSIPEDNFDNMIYWVLKDRLKKMRGISFDYEPRVQHLIVEIEKNLFWIQHGDTIRSWAGIPFYGADREKKNINEILGKFDTHIDYVLTAHFHTPADFNNIQMNGSFVGGDTYSVGRLRRMSTPVQKLHGVSEKHGIVWTRKLHLIDKPKKGEVKIYR